MALLVEKKLPDVLNGNNSIIKLIIAASKIKFCKLSFFRSLKFFKINIENNNAITNAIKNPTAPTSVKISR